VQSHLTALAEAANCRAAAPVTRGRPGPRVLGFDPGALSLVLGMLHADPAQRPTAARVMTHPWMAEVLSRLPPSRAELAARAQGAGAAEAADALAAAQAPASAVSDGSLGDVLQRTARLDFGGRPAAAAASGERGGAPGSVFVPGSGRRAVARPAAAAPSASLPPAAPASTPAGPASAYPVIGHVTQPVEVMMGGRWVVVSCLHAVYDVPGHGPMMSAQPVASTLCGHGAS
jgi:hypothetical protein